MDEERNKILKHQGKILSKRRQWLASKGLRGFLRNGG